MDATMYMMHPLEQQISNRTFFTMNRTEKIYSKNAPPEMKLGHWTSFFLAAGKGNSIIGILRALFYEYWREENAMIVYLLIDYFLIMIYENVEKAAALINNLPISNRNTWGLLQIINEEYSQLETLKKDGTYLYKLTYKIKFNNQINGKETVYHWLVNQGERIGVAE